ETIYRRGGAGVPPMRMGVLHNRHGTTLLRWCSSTSMYLRHFALGHCTANTPGGIPVVRSWSMIAPSEDPQRPHPLRFPGEFVLRQPTGAMDARPGHLAAGHVKGHDVDQTVAPHPAAHLHRRALGEVLRQLVDPALADADARRRVFGLALQHLD